MSIAGPSGNCCCPGRATKAVFIPAQAVPATSHPWAATSRHSDTSAPTRLAAHPDMRLPQSCLGLIETDAGDEPVLPYSGQGVAVDQEAYAAEHLFLFDVLLSCQGVSNATCE